MQKRTVKRNCEMIYSSLDDLAVERYGFQSLRYPGKIRGFGLGLLDEEKKMKLLFGDREREDDRKKEEDIYTPLTCDIFEVAFSLGYVVGQTFDIPNPNVQKAIGAIKNLLKEENLLPYLPREKAA